MQKKQNKTYIGQSFLYLGIYYLLVYVIAATPLALLIRFNTQYTQAQAIHLSNTLFISTHIITAICGIYLFRKLLKEKKDWILQHPVKWGFMMIGGFIAIIISGMLFIHGTSENQETLGTMMSTMPTYQLLLFKCVVVFIGPLNEEFVFREILIGQASHYVPKYVMWILSSLLFAYIHLPNISYFMQGIPYFVNGAILGWVYMKSNNNVLVSYSLHLFNNLMSLLV